MRTKEGQKRHDEGVIAVAAELLRSGWSTVYADLPGKAKPPQIGDYVPDVYGRHGIAEIVIEVETTDTVNTPHAEVQRNTFSVWARQSLNRKFQVRIA